MRPGIDSEWTDALAARGIRTALLIWFDFKSEPVGVWTGATSIMPMGTGDSLLDGVTFEPIANGLPVDIGGNQFNYGGSEELEIKLAMPNLPPEDLMGSILDTDEYQGRTAVMWRALMTTLPSATTPAEWQFRRVRAGSLDNVKIHNDGTNHIFSISIEAHASMISSATGSTYLDQPRLDPTDASQNFAVSIANNPQTPGGGSSAPTGFAGMVARSRASVASWNGSA